MGTREDTALALDVTGEKTDRLLRDIERGEAIGRAMCRPEPARVATAVEVERQRRSRIIEGYFREWAHGASEKPPFRYVADRIAEEEVAEAQEPERFDTSAD